MRLIHSYVRRQQMRQYHDHGCPIRKLFGPCADLAGVNWDKLHFMAEFFKELRRAELRKPFCATRRELLLATEFC